MDKSIIHKLVLFIAAICTTFSVSAYDFEVDGIYYDKISDTSVEVTHDENFLDNNGAGYIGNVTIPETIEINGITYFVCGIDHYAFYGCTGLTSVTIPEGVTSIGYFAFSGCTGLTSVSIPASVTSIDHYAFSGCNGLTGIIINESNPKYASYDGVLFNKTYTELILCPVGKAGIYNIPEGVTSISLDAFSGCTGLTSVTIPTSVTSIGEGAFSGCISLTSVTISEGVISIDNYAFYGCTGLTSVIIPASVTSIGDSAFRNCTGLASVSIPEGVTSIEDFAFRSCTGLTSVAIPASVTSIAKGTFRNCTGLISVIIPEGVTSIEDDAFAYCMALNRVICFAETVPAFGYDVFTGIPTACSVYVPSGTGGSYASVDELASYTIKEFGMTVAPAELILEVGATAELTASYTVDGAAETEKEISSVLGTDYIWSSSAENVAAVSTSGQVTARNAGTTEIKAITRFGNTVFATSTANVGTSGILHVSADGIKISAMSGKIMIENIGDNQRVSAYTTSGICQISQVSKDGAVEIPTEAGKIYIIAVDGFATKVIAK